VPAACPLQSGLMGWQEPAFPPGVVSQLLFPEHVLFDCHRPLTQMSCPF
jgi:hypothetical protein